MNAGTSVIGAQEVRHYSIDCQPWIRQGEEVVSATVDITPADDDFSIPIIFIQKARYVTFFVNGNLPDQAYDAFFTIVLSYQRRILCVKFRVAESCGVGVAL